MGMTIEEQIEALEYLKKCGIFPFSDIRTGIVITDEYVDGAIDTLRKYQRIQEIINNAKDSDGAVKYNWLYEQISEVVGDGKID